MPDTLTTSSRRRWVVRVSTVLATGILLGLGARAVMRVIAWSQGIAAPPSLGGSLEVVATGLIIGGTAAVPFLWFRHRLERRRRLAAGAAWGVLVFLALVAVPPPSARSAIQGAGSEVVPITLLLFGLIFLGWGILVAWADERWSGGA